MCAEYIPLCGPASSSGPGARSVAVTRYGSYEAKLHGRNQLGVIKQGEFDLIGMDELAATWVEACADIDPKPLNPRKELDDAIVGLEVEGRARRYGGVVHLSPKALYGAWRSAHEHEALEEYGDEEEFEHKIRMTALRKTDGYRVRARTRALLVFLAWNDPERRIEIIRDDD